MKKRFALYGMFAAMAIFAAACGDDSSSSASAPEDEEYSSSVDDEESSSSEEAVSSSSTKKDGKSSSSEAKKDGKSSSSEAKKDDESSSSEKSDKSSSSEAKKDDKSSSSEKPESSSSSEAKKDDKSSSSEKAKSSSSSEPESSSSEPESSSEITRSSDWDVNKLFCDVNVKEDFTTIKFGVGGVFEETLIKDASASKLSFTYEGSSCENIEDFDIFGYPGGNPSVSCEVGNCVATDEWARKTVVCTFEPTILAEYLSSEESAKELCESFMSAEVTTDYLNKKMFDEGKYGVMIDTREDAIYRTIKIGDQTWMAQNLNYEADGSFCYGGKPENCEKYGRLYRWEGGAAPVACPDGWRLPTKDEAAKLFETVSGTEGVDDEFATAGISLKSTEVWPVVSGYEVTNESGFSMLPAGYWEYEGAVNYYGIDEAGKFWTSTQSDSYGYDVYVANMYADENYASLVGNTKYNAYSVRCVKDAK